MSELNEKLVEAISNHIKLYDTYTYELTRHKAAFAIDTMTFDDFEEWTEGHVEALAESIVKALQPTLNENQQIVLEKMKNIQEEYDISFVFEELGWLLTTGGKMKYKEFATAYESLSVAELAQVLQAFASWALEQEEERWTETK